MVNTLVMTHIHAIILLVWLIDCWLPLMLTLSVEPNYYEFIKDFCGNIQYYKEILFINVVTVMKDTFTIATRKSPMAMWQAEYIQERLHSFYPDINFELLPMVTEGDERLSQSLANIGGKGLFLKELQVAMQQGRADMAVHSVKDIPSNAIDGFHIAAYCERTEVRDAFVSVHYSALKDCPAGSVIGSASLRRQCQVLEHYPHLQVKSVRGNVITRLQKLEQGEYDALLLSAAGLKRLNLQGRINELLPTSKYVPAIGQGAIGVECLDSNTELSNMVRQSLDHQPTRVCIEAERRVGQTLNASCTLPLAAFAELDANNSMSLSALVGRADGSEVLRANADGAKAEHLNLADEVAEQLIAMGAQKILAEAAL